MHRRVITTTVVAGVLALAGCGSDDDASSTAATSTPAASAKKAADLTIGVSNLGLSFPFPAAISKGMKAKAQELGVKLVELDGKGDANTQTSTIQDLISQKPDGVLVLPVDSAVAQGWVRQLDAAKIPVMSVASQIGEPKAVETGKEVMKGLDAVITQDEVAAGARAGQIATDLLPSGGKVAIVEGAAGFAEVRTRMAGFKKVLTDSGKPFDVVASQPGDWLPEKGESACQNMLAANRDLALIYAEADDMAAGCAKAVKAAKSKAKIVGIGGNKLVIKDIKSGEAAGTVCYKPEALGALAVQTMVDSLTGKKPANGEFVTYDTPAVTKTNVDDCVPEW